MIDSSNSAPMPASDTLRAYLAERDVPCPGCGYNLRGSQDSVCPECGGPVELTVTRATAGRGWLLFLLLTLGWVTLAAGMHTTRSALAARNEARRFSGVQVLLSSGMTFRSTVGQPLVINRSAISTTTGVGAVRTPITVQPTPIRTATGTTASSGPITISQTPSGSVSVMTRAGSPVAAGPTSASLSWSQVGVPTWVSLGMAGFLTLAAAVALVLVVLRRKQIVHAGPSRAVITFALAIFAVYAAGQLFLFVRDLVA